EQLRYLWIEHVLPGHQDSPWLDAWQRCLDDDPERTVDFAVRDKFEAPGKAAAPTESHPRTGGPIMPPLMPPTKAGWKELKPDSKQAARASGFARSADSAIKRHIRDDYTTGET